MSASRLTCASMVLDQEGPAPPSVSRRGSDKQNLKLYKDVTVAKQRGSSD